MTQEHNVNVPAVLLAAVAAHAATLAALDRCRNSKRKAALYDAEARQSVRVQRIARVYGVRVTDDMYDGSK